MRRDRQERPPAPAAQSWCLDEARPASRSFVTVEPAERVVAALKRAEDRETLIRRFFNITDEPVAEGRIAIPGAKRVQLVNLNEEPQKKSREGDTLKLEVGANKNVTVEFLLTAEIS